MKKIIIDLGRAGAHNKYPRHSRRFRRICGEDRYRLSMKSGWQSSELELRSQTDRLGPLQRFLRRNLGRPWTAIWSEICQAAPANSVLGKHLRDHVRYSVDQESLSQGKEPSGFFVDRKGLLQFMDHVYFWQHKRKSRQTQKPVWLKQGTSQAHQIRGIWYEVVLGPVLPHRVRQRRTTPTHVDVAFGDFLTPSELTQRYGVSGKRGVSKRQLNKKEIRRLKLRG